MIYPFYAILKLLLLITAFIINPILPLFGEIKKGWVNNKEKEDFEFFLPNWLYWFSTNEDNSLWGDEAHRIRHPNFTGYWAMVCWLYRNPAKGADWTVLGAPVEQSKIVKTEYGYKMGSYFQFILPGNYVFGWLLDASYGDRKPDVKASFVLGR